MEVSYKNNRQQEFCELLQTLENAGIYAAIVADLIDKTPGYISQVKSGKTNPSRSAVSDLRRIAKEKLFPGLEPAVGDGELHEKLEEIRRVSPDDYLVAKTVISSLHKKLPQPEKTPLAQLSPDHKAALKKLAAQPIERKPHSH